MFDNKILIYGLSFGAVRSLTIAFSVFYILSKGITLNELGIIKTFQACLIFFFDIPVSYFSDKFSRKFSIVLASLFSSVWLLTMSVADSFSLFLVSEFFNAMSLILFNGAFTAYLIDNNPKEKISNILSLYSKYNYITMAVFSLLGSMFVTIESSLMWSISGLLMLLCMFLGYRFLPKDSHTQIENNNSKTVTDIFKKDFSYLFDFIRNKEHKQFKGIAIEYILILLLMQIIIQYWQPYTFSNHPHIERGVVYGLFFAFLLLVQSLASDFYKKNQSRKKIVSTVLFMITITVSFMANLFLQEYISIISITLLFFYTQFNLLDKTSQFHETISANLRATFDSIISSLYRLLLIIVLPILTLLTSYFGWITVPILYIMYIVVDYFVKKRFF
ncbi:MAG: MFS transporter [Neisseriaceae bacterium]|nr:MAG: MFS transporter [Neisseriaceae bacterium]